jgi:hypothetical protein
MLFGALVCSRWHHPHTYIFEELVPCLRQSLHATPAGSEIFVEWRLYYQAEELLILDTNY